MAEAVSTYSGYKKPQGQILDVMRAPSPPLPFLSPKKDRMILVTWQDYPSIERISTPYLRLAGVRVEPRNNNRRGTSGSYGVRSYASSYELLDISNGTVVRIELPDKACATSPIWSADGEQFAFENITADSVDLWIGEGNTGAVQRIPDARLNSILGDELQWMPDQRTLLVKMTPDGRGPPPQEPPVPLGPSVQESDGKKGQSSTYEARDTLTSKHDEELFDYYAASQLALIDTSSMTIRRIGDVDRYMSLDASPDGQHLLVRSIRKPYSYVTTYYRFPSDVMVWDVSKKLKGSSLTIASLPLADSVPIRGVPLGPRNFSWRTSAPATLIWVEALDKGDWAVDVPKRDKIMLLKAPFNEEPVEIGRTGYRFSSYVWGENPEIAILSEYDINQQWRRKYVVNIDKPQQEPRLIMDISMKEEYKNPGNIVLRQLSNGFPVFYSFENSVFLAGAGASPDGDRPFLDRLNLETLESQRLFRSDSSSHEQFLDFSDLEGKRFFTWRQAPDSPPNVFQRTLRNEINAPDGEASFSSDTVEITNIRNPTPIVQRIKKRLITYKRRDGVELSFHLHTPPDYEEGTRVPTILYAYPLDYADKSQAGQVTGSEAKFTRLRKHQLLLLAGYAIMERTAFPIVGDPKKAYDTYLEQLIWNAEAAVAKIVEMGVANPDRIGITGHSHGALMVANLLAHTNLFRAGVATSGGYNKTLTPGGFQNERRSIWEAPDVYQKVSPFFSADKIKTPLLLVHGMDDANPGTLALQSSTFYEAVRANGGTTKLVLLPHEPHWYGAKESNEHLICEMLDWFGKYLSQKPSIAIGSRIRKI